jgi:hypothetical protein
VKRLNGRKDLQIMYLIREWCPSNIKNPYNSTRKRQITQGLEVWLKQQSTCLASADVEFKTPVPPSQKKTNRLLKNRQRIQIDISPKKLCSKQAVTNHEERDTNQNDDGKSLPPYSFYQKHTSRK